MRKASVAGGKGAPWIAALVVGSALGLAGPAEAAPGACPKCGQGSGAVVRAAGTGMETFGLSVRMIRRIHGKPPGGADRMAVCSARVKKDTCGRELRLADARPALGGAE